MAANNKENKTQNPPEKTSSIKEIFTHPWKWFTRIFCKCPTEKNTAQESIKMRENLSEKQIDNTVKSSFPASDPPSTY